jgi:CheY-like chemotaxis protein
MMSEKKILIVDDEAPIREMFEDAFTNKGYTVLTAEGSKQALDILKQENIYVMFLDLNMPGMNGVELCRRIKKGIPISIIHAVTGYASLFELNDCLEAGFDDYFTKPVDLNSLYEAADAAFKKLDRWKKR